MIYLVQQKDSKGNLQNLAGFSGRISAKLYIERLKDTELKYHKMTGCTYKIVEMEVIGHVCG